MLAALETSAIPGKHRDDLEIILVEIDDLYAIRRNAAHGRCPVADLSGLL